MNQKKKFIVNTVCILAKHIPGSIFWKRKFSGDTANKRFANTPKAISYKR